MEPVVTGHERISHDDLPVHNWRAPQPDRAGAAAAGDAGKGLSQSNGDCFRDRSGLKKGPGGEN